MVKKWGKVFFGAVSVGLFCPAAMAGTGQLFSVLSSGAPATISLTICLNGVGPISCQDYIVSNQDVSIIPTIVGHTYANMGIRINTPGYTSTNCTPTANGFCLFSASSSTPVNLTITNAQPLLAAGSYSNGTATFPLLALSENGGLGWTYSIDSGSSVLPAGTTQGSFSDTSCTGDYCMAAGTYTTASNALPLIVSSMDGGSTWTNTLNITTPTPPVGTTHANFVSTSCQGNTCFAGGYYNDGASWPVVVASTDKGQSWQYVYGESDLPAGSPDSGYINSVYCTASVCLAGGTYHDTDSLPLVAKTTNAGTSWSNTLSSVPGGGGGDSAYVYNVNCAGTDCLAVGQKTVSATNRPMLEMSSNSGDTWTDKTPCLPPTMSTGVFNTAKCTGSFCMAAGFTTNTNSFPAVVVNSSGVWNYTLKEGSAALPTPFTSGALVSGVCQGTTCLVAGSYSNGSNSFPLLLRSADSGQTWTTIIDASFADFPSDLSNGYFLNVGCEGLTVYPQ